MKYSVILTDGAADYPVPELDGKTPFEVAKKPCIDALAKKSELGMLHVTPDGCKGGSEIGNLCVMGYDPRVYLTGRSPLEARSLGIEMSETDLALRCNLVTLSADNDKTPDKYMTITYIAKNNTFVLMPYLPNAVIDGGNTIKQICEQSGEAEVAKLLSSKTGLSINKYIRFTKSTLTELFDMVGNTTLTVPSEIKYENKKDNTVTIIKQGTQIFTAEQMYAYLTLPDYGVKDELYPCKLNATVISSFIDQNFIGTSSKTLDDYINFIINFTNTNIEQSDYDAKVKAIVYTLSQNKSSVTDFYIPYGDKSGDDYIIDDNSWNSAKKALGTG